jgi:hypothetical protein
MTRYANIIYSSGVKYNKLHLIWLLVSFEVNVWRFWRELSR